MNLPTRFYMTETDCKDGRCRKSFAGVMSISDAGNGRVQGTTVCPHCGNTEIAFYTKAAVVLELSHARYTQPAEHLDERGVHRNSRRVINRRFANF